MLVHELSKTLVRIIQILEFGQLLVPDLNFKYKIWPLMWPLPFNEFILLFNLNKSIKNALKNIFNGGGRWGTVRDGEGL